MSSRNIVVVGAGPVGTVAALACARLGHTVTLLEAMKLAADRDMIARQYANGFADVFDFGVPAFLDAFQRFGWSRDVYPAKALAQKMPVRSRATSASRGSSWRFGRIDKNRCHLPLRSDP